MRKVKRKSWIYWLRQKWSIYRYTESLEGRKASELVFLIDMLKVYLAPLICKLVFRGHAWEEDEGANYNEGEISMTCKRCGVRFHGWW